MNELSLKKNISEGGEDRNSAQFFQQNEKDKGVGYFSERAKKLVTVVYIVTNLVPIIDPLRLTVRKFSIKLLVLVGAVSSDHPVAEIASEANGLCKKIVEMLEIAFFSGYISEMNFSILKSEFDVFLNEITGYSDARGVLDRNSFKVESRNNTMSFIQPNISKEKKLISRRPNMAENLDKSDGSRILPSKNITTVRKNSRIESIISIIKLKGNVNIKDISSVILNCSEKTIQRELMTLVTAGILKKSGDRRWSVYSMPE